MASCVEICQRPRGLGMEGSDVWSPECMVHRSSDEEGATGILKPGGRGRPRGTLDAQPQQLLEPNLRS